MKVLHAAALLTPPSGIIRQMEWEQEAARELGLHWDVRMYCPTGALGASSPVCVQSEAVRAAGLSQSGVSKLVRWVRHRHAYARWIRNVASDYDVLLLRYYVHDPFQLWLARAIDKPLFFVHHTKEIDELASAGTAGRARARLEALLGTYCIRSATSTIAVTREILDYEDVRANAHRPPGLVYPNGIRVSASEVADQRGDTPELLFVASEFHPWHGLDLLLGALEQSGAPMVLHLVGELADSDRKRAAKDTRVILHGKLDGGRIRQLAARCHVGLSSFALDRNGMHEACTLKVREYLDMGLPVYAGHRDVFPAAFPFYREEELDISRMLSYAKDCALVERQTVSKAAKPYIDKKVLLANLYSELNARVPL